MKGSRLTRDLEKEAGKMVETFRRQKEIWKSTKQVRDAKANERKCK